jgi:gluconolactonase
MNWFPEEPPPPPTSPRVLDAPDDLREVASGLGFPEGPVWCSDGSLLVVEVRGEALTRITPDGRTFAVAALPGGPNGAAVGPDGAIYVCNNGGLPWTQMSDGSWYPIDHATGSMRPSGYTHGWIERIHLTTRAVERIHDASGGRALSAPNDLAFDAHGTMWFTDTGKSDELTTVVGAVHRADAEGTEIAPVARLLGPNGIALTADGQELVVADTPTGRVWRWRLDALVDASGPGAPGELLATLPGGIALDSLAVDADNRVVVALPGRGALAIIEPTGAISFLPMPDPMPTNVCFGGSDLRTAYVTLGGFGRVVAFRWPCAGAPLPFSL